jgi:hypothetical protein
MNAWFGLQVSDIVGYMVSDFLGMLVFFWLRPTSATLAITASIFVSFHLFLAWLVITADHETGISLPIVSSIITHLSFLVVVYGCSALILALPAVIHLLPIYLWFFFPSGAVTNILALCIPGLAIFERYWLFSGGVKKKEAPLTPEAEALAAETAAVADAATASDYGAWLQYVAQQKPPFPKPGSSLKGEYERWLLAQARSRAATPSNIKQA